MVSRAKVRREGQEERRCVYRGGRKNRYMGKARLATMASRACSLEKRWSGLVGRWW